MPRVLTEADVAGFRDRLCEAATALFVERGHDNFNMRELAARLGVSPMTPYRYFRDKREILTVVRARAYSRFADQLEKAHAAPGTPLEKSAAVAQAYVHFALDEQACYRLMFERDRGRVADLPELFAAERRARACLTAHVRLLVEEGYFTGDPEIIGRVLWSALHGVMELRLTGELVDGEFDIVLKETLGALGRAFRTPKPEPG